MKALLADNLFIWLLVSDNGPAALDGADAYFAAVYEWLDESTDFVGGAEVQRLAQFDGRNEGVLLQQLTEQREQSHACMGSAESRRKKAEGQLTDGRQGLLDGLGAD